MGLVNLIFGAPVKVALGTYEPGIGVIEFDCSKSETHTSENEITDHPVEDGSVMSDHIRELPDGVEINGLVSDTPIVYLASQRAESPVKASENASVPAVDDRSKEAYTKIRELKSKKVLIDCVTSLRTYNNVTITRLVVTRDADTGRVLDCTVTLREIQKASALSLASPVPDDVANNAAAHKAKTQKKVVKKKQQEQAQSLLYSVKEGLL